MALALFLKEFTTLPTLFSLAVNCLRKLRRVFHDKSNDIQQSLTGNGEEIGEDDEDEELFEIDFKALEGRKVTGIPANDRSESDFLASVSYSVYTPALLANCLLTVEDIGKAVPVVDIMPEKREPEGSQCLLPGKMKLKTETHVPEKRKLKPETHVLCGRGLREDQKLKQQIHILSEEGLMLPEKHSFKEAWRPVSSKIHPLRAEEQARRR